VRTGHNAGGKGFGPIRTATPAGHISLCSTGTACRPKLGVVTAMSCSARCARESCQRIGCACTRDHSERDDKAGAGGTQRDRGRAGSPVRIAENPLPALRCYPVRLLPTSFVPAVWLAALTACDVSTGFSLDPWPRRAQVGEEVLAHMQTLLAVRRCYTPMNLVVLRMLRYVTWLHEYLTLMHVVTIRGNDRRGVLAEFTGVLCATATPARAPQAVHAWCGATLLRDLRSILRRDPDGQLWRPRWPPPARRQRGRARARERGTDRLDRATLKQIGNPTGAPRARANRNRANTPTRRQGPHPHRRFHDTRHDPPVATDLSVPFTKQWPRAACRPVKIRTHSRLLAHPTGLTTSPSVSPTDTPPNGDSTNSTPSPTLHHRRMATTALNRGE